MLIPQKPECCPRRVSGPLACLTLAAVLLSGCASIPKVKPEYMAMKPADVGLTPAATASGSNTIPLSALPAAEVPLAGEWWHALGDPQLDRIMNDALAGSPTLETAIARLRLMQAGVDIERAGLMPHASVDASE